MFDWMSSLVSRSSNIRVEFSTEKGRLGLSTMADAVQRPDGSVLLIVWLMLSMDDTNVGKWYKTLMQNCNGYGSQDEVCCSAGIRTAYAD